MRWLIALALSVGGCSQAIDGLGLTTGSITPAATPSTDAKARPAGAERVSGTLYRVMADDRKIADRIDRENYTLLKAAEATKAAGGTHFVLVSASDQSPTGMPSLKALTGNAGADYGAYFRVLEVDAANGVPVGAMSADEIIHFFGPKFGRSTPS